MGSGYDRNTARLILAEVRRGHGRAAADRLIRELNLDEAFGLKPGTVFKHPQDACREKSCVARRAGKSTAVLRSHEDTQWAYPTGRIAKQSSHGRALLAGAARTRPSVRIS